MPLFRRSTSEKEPKPISIWDISAEVERSRFEEKIASNDWRSQTILWFTSRQGMIGRLGVSTKDLAGEPYAVDNTPLKDLYYLRHLTEESLAMIANLFPQYEKYLVEIDRNCALIRSSEKQIHAMRWDTHLFVINYFLDPPNGGDFFDQNHGLRILKLVHELMHLLMYERFGLHSVQLADRRETNLASVLNELAVHTVIPELAVRLEKSTPDRTMLKGLSEYFRDWKMTVQAANMTHLGAGTRSDSSLELSQYLPAYQVAARLDKNGWSYADFPKLAIMVQSILREELGENYQEILPRLPMSDRDGSPSRRILARIRALKP